MPQDTTYNMRAGVAIRFGSDESERKYRGEVERMRAKLARGQVVVAPSVTVRVRGGALLHPGDEVTPDQIADLLDQETGELREVGRVRFNAMLRSGELVEGY